MKKKMSVEADKIAPVTSSPEAEKADAIEKLNQEIEKELVNRERECHLAIQDVLKLYRCSLNCVEVRNALMPQRAGMTVFPVANERLGQR